MALVLACIYGFLQVGVERVYLANNSATVVCRMLKIWGWSGLEVHQFQQGMGCVGHMIADTFQILHSELSQAHFFVKSPFQDVVHLPLTLKVCVILVTCLAPALDLQIMCHLSHDFN